MRGTAHDRASAMTESDEDEPEAAPEPPVTPVPAARENPAREQVSARTVFRWAVAAALGFLVVSIGASAVYAVRNLLVQVAIAAFVALSLDPAVRWLIRHKVPRAYAVTVIFVSFAAVLGVVIWLAVPPLVSEATKLTSDFPGYLENLRQRSPTLRTIEDRFNLQERLNQSAPNVLHWVQHEALGFGQRFLGALFSAILVIVLTIYFMSDLPRIRRAIVRTFPARQRPHVSHAVNVVIDKVGAYMIGNLAISAIAGVTSFIALEAVRVPFALPLAVFVAVTDLIPLVGATVGAVVCTIVTVATKDVWAAIIIAAFFLVYQQLENYFIAPRVLRNTVDMPSVAVLLAALLGGAVLGLVGALMAIPIAAAIKVIMTPMMQARDAAEIEPADAG
jgi:predicted PurR-regulated permease PerM